MGRVINWHKYRRLMTSKERKIEDFRILCQIMVHRANEGDVIAKNWLRETKSKILLAKAETR